ncbi:hypothetical protein DEJ50_31900 [Streptomyces venezuelae]|uniref:Uncharacterized protein n=1 Tax=Streptomyces venezuelae TaxID=54571 RepID=A0A5P2D9J2_STRVZ|nr:hypothetical protein [Streptomyces venezuelae]QES51775.1 hypothetical protein DEJ50_31900 [Streptomyces venezuelae]
MELAEVLWREHSIYRDRAGGVVIQGPHVQRWISLTPSAGRDEVLLRAGRILEGGTTAPARSEAVASLSAGTSGLAAVCRGLLAEVAAGPSAPLPGRSPGNAERRGQRKRRGGRPARTGRHTGIASWVVVIAVVAVVGLYVASVTGAL